MKEIAIGLCIAILIILGFFVLAFYFESYQCHTKANLMEFKASYGVVQGCMIYVPKTGWIPIKAYRVID